MSVCEVKHTMCREQSQSDAEGVFVRDLGATRCLSRKSIRSSVKKRGRKQRGSLLSLRLVHGCTVRFWLVVQCLPMGKSERQRIDRTSNEFSERHVRLNRNRSRPRMTRTNNVSEHSPSRTSSSSSSAIAQPSSTEPKDIINQNELTIQKLLLELQDDLKKTKECYTTSRDAWLSIQQPKSSTSSNENPTSQTSKANLTQALGDVQSEIEMYRTALSKISQVRQLQIEIANVTKSQIDVNRTHTTRRGLADLLSHMAYVLKIWYGNEHSGHCSNKVSCFPFFSKLLSCLVTSSLTLSGFLP